MKSEETKPLLERYHWVTFLLPLIVFMLVGTLEPTPEKVGGEAIGLAIPYASYPWVYVAKIVATVIAMAFVLPGYRKFQFKVHPLSVLVGVVGIVVWIGLCKLNLEQRLLAPLGFGSIVELGARSAFNPFEQLKANPAGAWAFLSVRFFGLVFVVAVIEEFFLRGFVMRYVVDAEWWNVPFGKVNAMAVLVGTIVPMLMHPTELFAAAAWFLLITWLMVRTKNIWDCIVAHAVTNLLLGIYVVTTGEWYFM